MKRQFTILALVLVSVSVAGGLVAGQARKQTATAPPSSSTGPAPATRQTGQAMTSSEHVAMMAREGNPHAEHAMMDMAAPPLQPAPANASLPADEAGAKARIDASPRKGEFVTIDVNGTKMRAWVVQPTGNGKAPVVVVIHEIFGLSDWIRGVADQLAAAGFIAVAPDLLAGHGPNGGDSASIGAGNDMTQATLTLPPDEITAKLKAARAYGLKAPRASGKSGVVGFCFGGTQSFAIALNEPALNAAVVYYGTAPTDVVPQGGGAPAAAPSAFVPSDRLSNIKVPVLGLYGGADTRIASSVPATESKMKALGKVYEPHIFEGAAHGFLRAQTGNDGANMKATEQAWPLTIGWLKKYTS